MNKLKEFLKNQPIPTKDWIGIAIDKYSCVVAYNHKSYAQIGRLVDDMSADAKAAYDDVVATKGEEEFSVKPDEETLKAKVDTLVAALEA